MFRAFTLNCSVPHLCLLLIDSFQVFLPFVSLFSLVTDLKTVGESNQKTAHLKLPVIGNEFLTVVSLFVVVIYFSLLLIEPINLFINLKNICFW